MKAVPNSYGFSKMNTTAFADATNTYPIFAATSSNKWEIKEKDEDGEYTETAKKHQKLISHAVPGDILVIAGYHVVIIQNLNYPEDSEVLTDFNQVDVIHSTEGGITQPEQWNVQKGIWTDLGDTSMKTYQLRRFVIKEN